MTALGGGFPNQDIPVERPTIYQRSSCINSVEVILVRTECAPVHTLGVTRRHESFDIDTQLFPGSPDDVPSHHRGFRRAGRKSAGSHDMRHVSCGDIAILPLFAAPFLIGTRRNRRTRHLTESC